MNRLLIILMSYLLKQDSPLLIWDILFWLYSIGLTAELMLVALNLWITGTPDGITKDVQVKVEEKFNINKYEQR